MLVLKVFHKDKERKEDSECFLRLLLTWGFLFSFLLFSGCDNADHRQRRELLRAIECPEGKEAYVEPPFYGCWTKKDLE